MFCAEGGSIVGILIFFWGENYPDPPKKPQNSTEYSFRTCHFFVSFSLLQYLGVCQTQLKKR